MELSGTGPSASGHRNRYQGVCDFKEAVGCIRAGHGPECSECHELFKQLSLRVEVSRRSLLLPTDVAPRERCVQASYARISDELRRGALEDDQVTVAYVTRLANGIVSEQFVEHLRAKRGDAWQACVLRLLQLACGQLGWKYGAPSKDNDMDDGSAGVLRHVSDDRERERIWKVELVVFASLWRHIHAGKDVRNAGGLMFRAVQRAATTIKERLKHKDEVAGIHNPERALYSSALSGQIGPDGAEGPAFELAAPDDTADEALGALEPDESEVEVRRRFTGRLTAIFEEQETNRTRKTTPYQRAAMILDAMTDPDAKGKEIADRYRVKRSYVYVEKNRFGALLKDPTWRDRLIRLFGADPAGWPLPQADAPTPPPGTISKGAQDAGDVEDGEDTLEIEEMDDIEIAEDIEVVDGAHALSLTLAADTLTSPPGTDVANTLTQSHFAVPDGLESAAGDKAAGDHRGRGSRVTRGITPTRPRDAEDADG